MNVCVLSNGHNEVSGSKLMWAHLWSFKPINWIVDNKKDKEIGIAAAAWVVKVAIDAQ